MEGYFKLHRKILESQVFAHQTALKIWIWCLSKASYKERFVPLKIGRGETSVKLIKGQFIFGRFKAEEELGIDGSTIYKWIQKFATKDFDMISIESNNQYSIITIINWDDYQVEENKKEQPSNNQVAAEEQPSNTNKKDNNVNNVLKEENKEEIFISEKEKKKQEEEWAIENDRKNRQFFKIGEYAEPEEKYPFE